MKKNQYIHNEQAHNLNDPSLIVPVIMDVIKPKSVVDVGCGIGTFLHVFNQHGVNDILGLDGHWVEQNLLSKHISLSNFKVVDLEKDFDISRKFDLALCLEVVEHLNEASADNIIRNLTYLSDFIIFSAAIPGQIGQNHVNEQWPDYWVKKFKSYEYTFYDVFRPIFWNNNQVARWYRQNMFMVVKNGSKEAIEGFEKYFDNEIQSRVHPDYYNLRVKESQALSIKNNVLAHGISDLLKGKASFGTYLKLLLKYFLRKIKLYNK